VERSRAGNVDLVTTSSRQAPPGPPGEPDVTAPTARRFGVRALFAVVGAFLVAGPLTLIVVLVLTKSPGLRRLDQGIEQNVHAYVVHRPALEDALRVGSAALHPRVMWVVVGVTAVTLWRRGLRRHAVWAVVTIAVGASIDTPLKELIARTRPVFPDPVATAPGYSFPSGHALNTMVVGAGAVALGWRATRGRPWLRTALLGGAAALVVLTGFDRVGLGVHYVSDVVGGWLIGLAVVLASTAAFNLGVRPTERDAGEPASPPPADDRRSS
jgi:membrane-associated phospholipid phosphatase